MFYLSSINGSKYGITDTVDDIEELYTGREIAKFVERDKITIYGVVIYNHTADNATILVPNISIEKAELIDICSEIVEMYQDGELYTSLNLVAKV